MGACDIVLEKWQDDDRYHRVIRDLHLQFLLFLFKVKRRRKEGKQKGREEGRERKIIDLTKCPLIGLHSVVSGNMGDWHASVLHERQQEGQLVRPFAVTGDPTW